jgi:hypothetical protein
MVHSHVSQRILCSALLRMCPCVTCSLAQSALCVTHTHTQKKTRNMVISGRFVHFLTLVTGHMPPCAPVLHVTKGPPCTLLPMYTVFIFHLQQLVAFLIHPFLSHWVFGMERFWCRKTYTGNHQLTDDSTGLVWPFNTSNTSDIAVTK